MKCVAAIKFNKYMFFKKKQERKRQEKKQTAVDMFLSVLRISNENSFSKLLLFSLHFVEVLYISRHPTVS